MPSQQQQSRVMSQDAPGRLAVLVATTDDLDSSAVRVACWLMGVMLTINADTVTLSYRQIQRGYELAEHTFPGTGCRTETVRAALEWLHSSEWFEVTEGATPKSPKTIRVCL